MEKNRKIVWGAVLCILILAVLAGFFCLRSWYADKQEKIQLGLSNDKFPWRDYSVEELEQMHPQIKNANIPTRVTPEETYAKFREALRTNNLEMAVEQLAKEGRFEENRKTLEDFYKENKFNQLYTTEYPAEVNKSTMGDTLAEFYFTKQVEGHSLRQDINFTKNSNGDWKMSSL